jgi:Transposase DDE domain
MKLLDPFLDNRLKKVGEIFFDRVLEEKKISLRGISRNRAEEIQLGRWLRNEKVTVTHLIRAEQARVRDLVLNRHVLAIQDTTELNYQSQAGRVSGLGTVGDGTGLGFFMHPMLVLDAQTNAFLGSAEIHLWNRLKGASDEYQKLPIEEKESYRWILTAQKSREVLSQADSITFVGDRENDIYEFIDRIPDEKTFIITRVQHNRVLSTGERLKDHMERKVEAEKIVIEIPREMRRGREERKATLSIKYSEIEIRRPERCTDKKAARTIRVRLVEAKETDCPAGEEPVHWMILTTHAVTDFEKAKQIILWYKNRWNIEQVFRTMKKQGLDIESSEVESGKNLMKLAVIALCASIKIMQLVLARTGTTGQKTEEVFNDEEQKFLEILLPGLEGKTEKQKNPYSKDNLGWASWIIARLGSWQGYVKGQRPPGPIVMGRGLEKFYDLYSGYKLYQNVYTQ